MLTLVFVLGLVLLYLHTYVHFYVNPLNELMTLDDVYRQELTSQLYSKLPILFHAKTIRRDPEIRCVPSVQREGYVVYETLYEPVSLLEPSVKFFPSSKVYQFADVSGQAIAEQAIAEQAIATRGTTQANEAQGTTQAPETSQAQGTKQGMTQAPETKPFLVETHLACRTFYRIHTGKYKVTCIHPKYTDHFTRGIKEPSFIHEHPQMLHLELHQDSILFLPNYWYVLLEPIVPGQIEVIQYSTPLNLLNFAYDQLMDVFKLA
jgi:hypothetical protein